LSRHPVKASLSARKKSKAGINIYGILKPLRSAILNRAASYAALQFWTLRIRFAEVIFVYSVAGQWRVQSGAILFRGGVRQMSLWRRCADDWYITFDLSNG